LSLANIRLAKEHLSATNVRACSVNVKDYQSKTIIELANSVWIAQKLRMLELEIQQKNLA